MDLSPGAKDENLCNQSDFSFKCNRNMQKEFDAFAEGNMEEKNLAFSELLQQNQALGQKYQAVMQKLDCVQQESSQLENEVKVLRNERDNHDHYCKRSKEIQRELEDFQEASASLEKELETDLVQKEEALRKLQHLNKRLEQENDFIKKKMDRMQQENTQLENEVKALKNEKENRAVYIRDLEQKNDDLERSQRVMAESIAGIEALLIQAFERNTVLETEVEEMETIRVKLQRASDEVRDLKQELTVKDKVPNGNISCSNSSLTVTPDSDPSRKLLNGSTGPHQETETQTSTPVKLGDMSLNGNAMTPSSRISALNIVGDLLRKVGLERFLCPECSKVRCVCLKEKSSSTPHLHQPPPNRETAKRLSAFKPSESPDLSPTIDGKDVPKFSHWLNGILPNNSPSKPQTVEISRDNNGSAVDVRNNVPTQRDIVSSLFSRGASFRRSTSTPPKPPPRSPTKTRVPR